jgi:hypothetical protein
LLLGAVPPLQFPASDQSWLVEEPPDHVNGVPAAPAGPGMTPNTPTNATVMAATTYPENRLAPMPSPFAKWNRSRDSWAGTLDEN